MNSIEFALHRALLNARSNWRPVAVFVVHDIPKAQPRSKVRGNSMGVFDPGTAKAWKAAVQRAAREHLPKTPLDGPLRVDIDFLLPRPKDLMGKKYPDGEIWSQKRPDRDNLDKAVLDCLTDKPKKGVKGFWNDDGQVCAGEPRTLYHAKDGAPGARIMISVLEDSAQ